MRGREERDAFFFFLAYPTMTQVKTEISDVQWEVGKHSCLNRSQSVIRFRPKESRKMDREHSENDLSDTVQPGRRGRRRELSSHCWLS